MRVVFCRRKCWCLKRSEDRLLFFLVCECRGPEALSSQVTPQQNGCIYVCEGHHLHGTTVKSPLKRVVWRKVAIERVCKHSIDARNRTFSHPNLDCNPSARSTDTSSSMPTAQVLQRDEALRRCNVWAEL